MPPALNLPDFVCPRCHGPLQREPERYECRACAESYPIVLGIPDFRVFPDPWIGFDEDRQKSIRLEGIVRNLSFEAAVRAYWEITPATRRPLAERYIQHVLESESRASDWLDWLAAEEAPSAAGPWLDIGCGTGDLVAAGAAREIAVVGADIALRWLVVARRREILAGRETQLVCANGERLPYAPGSFARVVSLGTLEHARDPYQIAREARRVVQRGGLFRLRTVNRYTLLREPHVQVWGVGLVPRRMADRYVQLFSDQRYINHKPLSSHEVGSALKAAGFREVSVRAASFLATDAERIGSSMRRALPVYNLVKSLPVLRAVTRWVAPLLDARGVAI